MKEKGYVCFCTCGFLRLSVLTFFLRLLTMCMMPLAAGIFDCKMLYSSPGKSWYRKDLAYVWVIKKKSKKKLKKLFPCGESVLTSYSYKSVLMGQQGEGTARVTLEKVNVRDGLGVRQALPPTWVWVIFWFWLVLLSLNTEKQKNSPGTPCSRIECEQCLITALGRKGDHRWSPWPPHGLLEAVLELQLWLQLLLTHCPYKESPEQRQSSQAHWISRHMSGPSSLYGPMHCSLVCEGVPRLTYKLNTQVLVLQPWFKFREAQLSCAFHFTMRILNCSSLP